MNASRITRLNTMAALLAVLSLAGARTAAAQGFPAGEISGGYNLLRTDGETLRNGWYADASGSLTSVVSLVGQVTGNYKTLADVEGVDVDASLHSFMGGIRLNGRTAAATPFVHVLFGGVRTAGNTALLGDTSLSASKMQAALQLGGGVNVMAAPNLGIRIGGDYLRGLQKDGGNAFRFSAGVVVPFGRR